MLHFIQAVILIGGLLLLIAPFVARFRREYPRWVQLAIPFAGALTEIHVALKFYLNGLQAAGDPHYWQALQYRSFLRGIIIGILLSFLLQYFCDRMWKARDSQGDANGSD